MDEYERKFEAALAQLGQSGMWQSNFNPPFLGILRRMGRKPLPPHYQSFKRNFIGLGLWFAICWGLLMWTFSWSASGMAPAAALISATIAGVFFGLFMAGYYERGKRKYQLSRWDDL